MVLIVTLQIDLHYSYCYCNSFKIYHKSSSKAKRWKPPVLYQANSVKCFNIILSGEIKKNPGPGSHPLKCNTFEKLLAAIVKKYIAPFVETLLF